MVWIGPACLDAHDNGTGSGGRAADGAEARPAQPKHSLRHRSRDPAALRNGPAENRAGQAEKTHPLLRHASGRGGPTLRDRGEGKLYIGFHLDPLYAVHWNNRVKPLEFRLETPEGVRVTPNRGTGPKVEQPADKDPREFLLDIAVTGHSRPLHLTVRYFACDDADTFCIPVTQSYAVHLEPDPEGESAGPGSDGDSSNSGASDSAD